MSQDVVIDPAAPVLEFNFLISEALDDQDLMDTMKISSTNFGSLGYKFAIGSKVPSVDSEKSAFMSFDTSSTILKVTFASFEELIANIGANSI